MLRSVKSTQRKIKQLEVLIECKSITISGIATNVLVVKGPAQRQLVTVDRRSEDDAAIPDQDLQFALDSSNDGGSSASLELKQPFTEQDPVVIANGSGHTMNTSPASGASSSKIVVTSSAAFADGDKVSMLIIGSDTSEKY